MPGQFSVERGDLRLGHYAGADAVAGTDAAAPRFVGKGLRVVVAELLDELAQATEELILQFNPSWTMADSSGLCPGHIDELVFGGFELVEQFCYDHDRVFTHAGWRGRMRTCNGVGSGSLSDDEVEAFARALAELLRQRFPAAHVPVRHRVWATVVRRP